MQMTPALRQFIQKHLEDDPHRLALSAKKQPEIDLPFAVKQITIRQQIKKKLPTWYTNESLIFSSTTSAEQCSSEQTALYKQHLIKKESTLCDLTGGVGVDSYFFSQRARKVIYIERDKDCYDAARYNFQQLGADNIEAHHADAIKILPSLPSLETYYIDPARRDQTQRRVFALTDCEPNLLQILPVMREKCATILVKLSPMLDIRHTYELLPDTAEIHILSVKNECKELLFLLHPQRQTPDPKLICTNFNSETTAQQFTFTLSEERNASVQLSDHVKAFLFEPNSAIMKAGGYKQVSEQLHVEKLHTNSHLYTADSPCSDFPGRSFVVEEVLPFNNRLCATIAKQWPSANIATRNFPLSVKMLRQRTKITEGGDRYLFATTLSNEERVVICCRKTPITVKRHD